jgi:rhamnose utilization protein RhaD (predicted bifunctional aldolase and dehydrogenase)
MKSLWDEKDAARCASELALRAYTSRLLGRERALVLYGGGNTSVKVGKGEEEILYVKGSGRDLAQATERDFAPVRLEPVRRLIEREALDDQDMMEAFRAALKDPAAPRPSIETILHAVLPFKWVEHTHADAVLAVADTRHGEEHVRAAFGDAVLIVPYRHSGFELAKCCHEVFTRQATPKTIGMVLMHHGIFAFGQTARESYGHMIGLVTRAEDYLKARRAWNIPVRFPAAPARPEKRVPNTFALAALRREISLAAGFPLVMTVFSDLMGLAFARRPDVASLTQRGPATPQHAVFTKRVPLVGRDVEAFAERYRRYVTEYAPPGARNLPDPAPRIVLDSEWGFAAAGVNVRYARATGEIWRHAMKIQSRAEALGGYVSLPPREVLAAEIAYGGFERKVLQESPLAGRVALVAHALTNRDETETLLARGAAVVGLDRDPAVGQLHHRPEFLGIGCDPSDRKSVEAALDHAVRAFGGIDILVAEGQADTLREVCQPLLALSPLRQ